MTREQRIPERVRVRTVCRLETGADVTEVRLVDVSPEGACVDLDRSSTPGAKSVLSAWMEEKPVRVRLGSDPRSIEAVIVWTEGARGEDESVRLGLRFDEPVRDFGSLVRSLSG